MNSLDIESLENRIKWPPPGFHMMAKPVGAACNLNCTYCFFLTKERLYPGSRLRMSDEVLEEYIKQYIGAQEIPRVTVTWQGGEPTMMGLEFFKRVVELEHKYVKPGVTVEHSIQTNGTLLDDELCGFFRENNYLVGVSIDGPRELHDAYRVDKSGGPTFDRVMKGIELLKKHRVDFNILCTVNAANGDHPLDVYRFFRNELRAEFIQFIAIVERDNETGFQEGSEVTNRSVNPQQYGDFLIGVFDEWVRNDVGKTFVQIFDVSLANWAGEPAGVCIFSPVCGAAPVMEHNGDIYSCDHFVEPDYLMGNIASRGLPEIMSSNKQRDFGLEKLKGLPACCRGCELLFACWGGCPKNRFTQTPDGEPGLNYLCDGYKAFFKHIDRPMKIMADLLKRGLAPAHIMQVVEDEEADGQKMFAAAGRNDPCPCGSGKKYKHCHGKPR